MARGGSRKHPPDCKCGKCPSMGRPKQQRPTNANVASKVLAQAKAEKLWLSLISLECRRLGINERGELEDRGKRGSGYLPEEQQGVISGPDYQGKFSIIPLTNLLRYLEDRAYGRPMDTVNHLHDKPIEHEVTIRISEVVRNVRERKLAYERSRR